MRIEPTLEVRQFFIAALGGISCPALNMPTQDQKPPYVLISTRSTQEQLTKCPKPTYRITTTFDIIVANDGDWGGDKQAEDIANEMLPLIMMDGQTANFNILFSHIDSSDPMPELYSTGRVIRKVINVINFVTQL